METFFRCSDLTTPRSIEAWYSLFSRYTANQFREACRRAVLANEKGFDPKPADVQRQLDQMKERRGKAKEEVQFERCQIEAYEDAQRRNGLVKRTMINEHGRTVSWWERA